MRATLQKQAEKGDQKMPVNATKETLKELTATGTVVVDFWAPWCGPCKVLDPILSALEKELSGLKVVRYNVEADATVPQTLGIMTVPTIVVYQQGQPKEKVSGVYAKEKLKRYFEKKLEAAR